MSLDGCKDRHYGTCNHMGKGVGEGNIAKGVNYFLPPHGQCKTSFLIILLRIGLDTAYVLNYPQIEGR